jgi:hypothetical protein
MVVQMLKWYRLLSIVAFLLSFSIAFAEDINVTVNVTPEVPAEVPVGLVIMKTLVGLGIGIGFIGSVLTLLFGIDFFRTKNPLASIVMAVIGLAVILLMFIYVWASISFPA